MFARYTLFSFSDLDFAKDLWTVGMKLSDRNCDEIMNQFSKALLEAPNSSSALKDLYKLAKAHDSIYSIPYICQKSGIVSVGYFSDVIHGKRRLHKKYQDGISKAFKLKETNAKCLKLLISIDNEKRPDDKEVLLAKLQLTRKKMSTVRKPFSSKPESLFFALEVYCAFGLFKNIPKTTLLRKFFSDRTSESVDRAISVLVDLGLIARRGIDDLELTHSAVDIFGNHITEVDYLKLAFRHGIDSLSTWYLRPESSLFTSASVSVKKAEYEAELLNLREYVEELRAKLETDDGDLLVRMNFQVYPINK